MDTVDKTESLAQKMLKKPLYVVQRIPNDLTRFEAFLEAHLQWAVEAEGRGELFASGPFVEEDGVPGTLGGMSVLRAETREDAEKILSGDPFIREKIYTPIIRKWLLMEGELTVTVRFSNRSYSLK